LEEFFKYAGEAFQSFGPWDAVEIGLFAVFSYYVSLYLKKINANWYNKFLFVFVVGAVFLGAAALRATRAFFAEILIVVILTTVIIFAQDIKRSVWRLSRPRHKRHTAKDFSDEDLRRSAAEVVRATQNLAKKNIGALMIFPRTVPLGQIMESGTHIDAAITSQAIETIFFQGTALHDGAVVFMNNRLVAAGCFLPLSVELNIPKELGTRHRAAIGITETMADAVALVVSEETGIISITFEGRIYRYLNTEQLTVSVEAALGLRELSDMPFLKNERTERKEEE
jgi:diadenylate cyclase